MNSDVDKEQIPGHDAWVITGPWESAYGIINKQRKIVVFKGWHNSSVKTRHCVRSLAGIADEQVSGKPDWNGEKFVVKNQTSEVPRLVGGNMITFREDYIREIHEPLHPRGEIWRQVV